MSYRGEERRVEREAEIEGEQIGEERAIEGEELGGEGLVRNPERRVLRSGEARYERFRRREERQIEVVTLGLTLVVFMIPVLFPSDPNAPDGTTPLVLMLGGMILLAGAFFQVQRRFFVNPLTWLGGAAMLAFGFYEFQTKQVPLGPLLPVLLFGGVILGSFMTGQF